MDFFTLGNCFLQEQMSNDPAKGLANWQHVLKQALPKKIKGFFSECVSKIIVAK